MKIKNAIGLFFRRITSWYKNRKYVNTLNLKGHEIILEIGAYKGFLSREILKKIQPAGSLTCSDFEADYLNDLKYVVKKYNNTNFLYGNIQNINLGKDIYDIIILNNALHNVTETKRVAYLESLKKILKPDGIFYIKQVVAGENSINSSDLRQAVREAGLREIEYVFHKMKKLTLYLGTYKKV